MNPFTWAGRFFKLSDPRASFFFSSGGNDAGVVVNESTVLNLSAAWACIRVNSEAVAATPLQLFEKDPTGGRNRVDHPLADIIGVSPDGERTAGEFWGAVAASLLMYGNAFAEIVRLGGRVTGLNLILAPAMQVIRDESNDLIYRFVDRGKQVELPAESVLHIRGWGFGSDLGLSPLHYGAQVFGGAIATERHASRSFANGANPTGYVTADEGLTDEQLRQVEEIIGRFTGSANAGRVMALPGGLKFEAISLDHESMQMLATRQMNVESVCRLYGTPPVVVGHAANGVTAWGSGIESLFLQWLTVGLDPLYTRIEKRVTMQLLSAADRRRVYAEFNRESLMRADSAAKIAFLSGAVQNGLMSRNEARAKLNLPAVEGGDVLTAQTNLAPLDQLGATDPRAAMRDALGITE